MSYIDLFSEDDLKEIKTEVEYSKQKIASTSYKSFSRPPKNIPKKVYVDEEISKKIITLLLR